MVRRFTELACRLAAGVRTTNECTKITHVHLSYSRISIESARLLPHLQKSKRSSKRRQFRWVYRCVFQHTLFSADIFPSILPSFIGYRGCSSSFRVNGVVANSVQIAMVYSFAAVGPNLAHQRAGFEKDRKLSPFFQSVVTLLICLLARNWPRTMQVLKGDILRVVRLGAGQKLCLPKKVHATGTSLKIQHRVFGHLLRAGHT